MSSPRGSPKGYQSRSVSPSSSFISCEGDASPLRKRSSNGRSNASPSNHFCSALRYILAAVAIGSTCAALIGSLHMSTGRALNDVLPEPALHPVVGVNLTEKKVNPPTKDSHTTRTPASSEEVAPFVNLPPPPTLKTGDSFAACLLIKDDNHWLTEWLAYHYFVMPLRRLIVVVDPESKTSPHEILNRWSSRGLMNITFWKDEDFLPKQITANASHFDNNEGLKNHRVRQNNFYRKCIPKLRRESHTYPWLMLVDTDEYVVPSYASGHFRNITEKVPFTLPGSVLRLLKYHQQVLPEKSGTRSKGCIYMPRFFFGAKESRQSLVEREVKNSTGIYPANMVTQSFLYREPRRHFNGKNLINLRRLPSIKVFTSVHHVSSYCPDPAKMRDLNQNKHSLFRVHHYLGTEDQYFFRDDPRALNLLLMNNTQQNASADPKKSTKQIPGSHHLRDKSRYNELNAAANHEDHAAKAWLRGFVNHMGVDTAAQLLKDVGIVGVE